MAERIVEVIWEDAASSHGWQETDELPQVGLVRIVGYVDRDDEEGIRVVEARATFSTKGGRSKPRAREWGCATMIPRSAIREVHELTRKRRS